jgi:hypothetical protein
MIEKIWDKNLPDYDKNFDLISDNIWDAWREECNSKPLDLHNDAVKFERRFSYKPIIGESKNWKGLRFRNEGHYMLFLLEWA